ncbi:MAG TPA: hypothetical protein VGH16_05910 [Candidatus Binatia bacterium]|jgi:hypothetical protein
MVQWTRTALAITLLVMLCGCGASKLPFNYAYSSRETPTGNVVVAIQGVRDNRTDREIDKIYANSPSSDLNTILKEEISGTGLVKSVVVKDSSISAADLRSSGANFLVIPILKELRWEVPGYDTIKTLAFTTSFLTGGVGGLIYGSTPTDVYGIAELSIQVVDLNSADVLDKAYTGRIEDRRAKLVSDTPGTKNEMVTRALKEAVDKFRADLIAFVQNHNKN